MEKPVVTISLKKIFMKNSGVSEIIGGVLLVSIVITGMAIIGVFLLSSPPPGSIPKTSFLVYAFCDETYAQNTVMISHQGGDAIHWSEIKFIVNPEESTIPDTPYCSYSGNVNSTNSSICPSGSCILWDSSDKTELFETGETLKIITPSLPNRLIIYTTIGSKQTILDTEFSCNMC